MHTQKVIYPNLSYKIVGICFKIHNRMSKYHKEIEYCDAIERELIDNKINYKREHTINKRNRLDFLIENKIILEIKSVNFISRSDYYQLQRYLQITNCKLGLLINFNNNYLNCKRVIRIDKFNASTS